MCDHINHNIAASKRCGEHYHHLFNLLLLFVVRRLKMTMPTRANMWQPKSKNDKHQMQSQHMTWHFVSVRGCMRGRHLSLSHQCRHIGNVPTTVQNLLHGIRNGSSSAHTQCHCLFESIILCSRRTPSHFSSPWLLLPPPAHRIRRHTHIVFASFFSRYDCYSNNKYFVTSAVRFDDLQSFIPTSVQQIITQNQPNQRKLTIKQYLYFFI